MARVECVVIGAGQAGLAMSRCLTERGVDHVVLERGRVAERWRSERWDSLRLLTPNWQSRLPGFEYDGPEPDGFMTMPEVVRYFERYATSFLAPVRTEVEVTAVMPRDDGYRVATSDGEWQAPAVVIATGYSDRPSIPAIASSFPSGIAHVAPTAYKNPSSLPDGGVLVVGASASGIQLADELRRAGREVTLAVGHHTRLPRRYRGRDILWWLDRMGVFDETVDQVYDVEISREQPSLQLIGHPDGITLDLAGLHARGVRIVGRLTAVSRDVARFADDLVTTTAAADIKLASLLRRIDRFVEARQIEADPAPPFAPHCFRFVSADTRLDLAASGTRSVLWATGFKRAYPWLHVPVLDASGEVLHAGGVTPAPGLYVIGLHFLRRRNSSFIDGVGADARALSTHLAAHLESTRSRATVAFNARPALVGADRGRLPAQRPLPARDYDAVVVGARPAGAFTALLLARHGMRVLVIDRGRYGADTLSTHALMRGGVVQLARWGVLPRVQAAGTPPVRRATFVYGGEAVGITVKPRDGVDALYAPRRTVLDPAVVDAALDAGAEVSYGTGIHELVRGASGRVIGLVCRDQSGWTRSIRTGVVIGADGMRSTVARMVGAPITRAGQSAAAVVFGYWQGVHADGYRWYYAPGLSVGAIPTNAGDTCIFASVPAARFAELFRGDIARGYHEVIQAAAPDLAAAMRHGELVGTLHGFPGQPGFYRRAAGPGWALIGDAGYFKDPITAHGITDALVEAEHLQRALMIGSDTALTAYETGRDLRTRAVFDVTDRLASFDWTLDEARVLHKRLADAMAAESQALTLMAREEAAV